MEWTDRMLDHIASALASPVPSPDQVDAAQLARVDLWLRYHHTYYCPRCWPADRLARMVGGAADGPFLLTTGPLRLSSVVAFQLIPVDTGAIWPVLLPYYKASFGHLPREVMVLLDPTSGRGRGAMIHPSTRITGQWQVTAIDREGPTSHQTVADWGAAVRGCLDRGLHNPATHRLDELAMRWLVAPVKEDL